jgi:hypothetical protein
MTAKNSNHQYTASVSLYSVHPTTTNLSRPCLSSARASTFSLVYTRACGVRVSLTLAEKQPKSEEVLFFFFFFFFFSSREKKRRFFLRRVVHARTSTRASRQTYRFLNKKLSFPALKLCGTDATREMNGSVGVNTRDKREYA